MAQARLFHDMHATRMNYGVKGNDLLTSFSKRQPAVAFDSLPTNPSYSASFAVILSWALVHGATMTVQVTGDADPDTGALLTSGLRFNKEGLP